MVYSATTKEQGGAPGIRNLAIAQTSERRVWWTFFLAGGLAVIVAISSLLSIVRLQYDNDWVVHTEQVIAALDHVLSLATDMETAGRGFVITGTTEYLEPYASASNSLNSQMDHLRALVSDNPSQNQRLVTLSQLLTQRQAEVTHDINVRRNKGFDAARADVLTGVGKRIHDHIRVVVNALEGAERILLKARLTKSERSMSWSIASVILGMLLVAGLVIFAQAVVRRDYAGSRRANVALGELNRQLDARVAERTAELTKASEQLKLADAVFKNIQEGIVITDPAGRIIAVNPAFSRVTEYPPNEAIGQNIRILQSGRHARSFYLQMWESVLTTGSWQGEVWNRRRGGDIYKEWRGISTIYDTSGKPKYYIGVASDLSRMNRTMTDLEHLAHHDALTGLPNRLLLASRLEHSLERARRDGALCAVLCLDLDRFKAINDTLGHAAGDELLRQVAERIKLRLRDVDTLARVGGDELVVVLEGIFSSEEATAVAATLIAQLAHPFVLSGLREAVIGASVGISIFPADAGRPSELLEMADLSLYLAKRAGGNQWHLSAQSDALNFCDDSQLQAISACERLPEALT